MLRSPARPSARMELDDDPDVAVAVLTGNARGDKSYAALCLRIAITAGRWPRGWYPRG
jgi:hypothetical protein